MKKTTKKIIKGIQIVSVAGLTTMMLCENVQYASGQEESAVVSECREMSWAQMSSEQKEALRAVDPELAAAKESEFLKTQQASADSETVSSENQGESTEEQNPSEEEKKEETDSAAEDGKTDDSQNGTETGDTAGEKPSGDADVEKPAEEETTETDSDAAEKPADGTTSEDSSAEQKPADETTSDSSSAEQKPADTTQKEQVTEAAKADSEVQQTTDNTATVEDTNPEAVYEQKDYDPSEAFISRSEKITYNISVPIEGLPGFITQEMIIGALKCQDETGYPASVTIAQIIQESGFGAYGQGGDDGQGLSYLAYQYCNLFGIKGTGTAGSVNMKTGEQAASGESYTITAGFRAYHTYTECIEDRTQLLQRVYSDLTDGVTDANTFAMQVGSRWATSHTYGQNLIRQMEYYDLYRLDSMTLEDFSDMIGTFTNPCPGASLTSDFGYRDYDHSFHKGIDLGTGSENIPTYAAAAGTVVTAGWSDTAGNWVVIEHENGLVTKYMHHAEIYVTEGQKVEKGQQIGITGTTGNSSGNHLHFQVEENGVAVDPEPYLRNQNTQLLKMNTSKKSVALNEKLLEKIKGKLTKSRM